MTHNLSPTGYRMLHYWVEKQLGKPMVCDNCETTEKKRYHWANLSGEYKKDTSDWARLCVRCHCRIDGIKLEQPYCKRGHAMEGDNVAYKFTHNVYSRYCKKCSNLHWRTHYHKHKLLARPEGEI